jgi:type IV secretory pathway TrbD component
VADLVEGWTAPVYRGLMEPLHIAHVPEQFFIGTVLVTLMVGIFWHPMVVLGGLAYGLARLGTAYDPDWLNVLTRAVGYTSHYEG